MLDLVWSSILASLSNGNTTAAATAAVAGAAAASSTTAGEAAPDEETDRDNVIRKASTLATGEKDEEEDVKEGG